ncbi:alpha/beta hydrolase family protein [Roseateles saccharophilus]|uniref:Acyl-peptide hydrolase n=1 Tax=Roseateles saccharophilus TaxID=304 RepID=A0A4R3V4Y7_ROSSA|nr:S9 family peptidase [Roseateles saccharophilus]MDG0831475.1 S9 family peptidase [Roseateles saccharophilus]TCU98642.1 dipeptidyl aminopeptidase/acylaminoacyl peptidase [Roseateles saccharophilus]
MSRPLLTLAATLALLVAAPDAATAADKPVLAALKPAKRYTIEQFMATVNIGGASFSADESRILFHSNETGIYNVYAMPVGGGKPQQLTDSKTDSHYAVGFFPGDDRFLYTRDKGGNELNHLYVREPGGSERDLTPGDKLKARFAGWSGDDTAFYVGTNERDERFFDLYRYDAKTYARTLVFKNEAGWEVAEVSRDGRWLALAKVNTTADSDVHLADLKSGEIKHITPHQGVAQYAPQDFTPDNRELLMTSNDGGEFARVVAYDLATGKTRDVERADWDVEYTSFSKDGRHRVTGINVDASIALRLYSDGKPVALPKLPGGEVRGVAFSRSGKRMAFYVNGDRSPNNLFVADVGSSAAPRQLTQSLSKDIDPNELVDASIARFRSFDGMVIPSVYMVPKEASPTHKVPAIVWVHGGPGGETMRGYSALMQYFVNNGYAVLGINNRGSSGYGKSFNTADDGRHGREPLWDCVEAKTFLAGTGVIDPERIGIVGGSYGGYMVLSALAFRPEAFKVGIDIFGVANWIRTLESIPPYWESFRQALYQEIGDPVKDRERLMATSPLFHAGEIRKPLMVVQGANDPRVIKPESDDIVAAVKKNGVPVDYLVFDDEGHGFSKKKNQIEANRRMVEFLDKYLKP